MKYNARTPRTIAALVAAGAMTLTVGCSAGGDAPAAESSGGGATGPVSLSFWAWVPGMEDVVDLWNEENPDVQVEFTRIASADATNLPSQIDAGTAPDIAQVEIKALTGFVVEGQAQDIREHVADSQSQFSAPAWAGVSIGDGVYGVPEDAAPSGMMYRQDIFAEHDIEVPTTWEEYVAAAEALHAADPDVYIAQFSPNELGLFHIDQMQTGNRWFATEGDAWTVGISDPDVQTVAERYQYLLDNDLVKVEQMWTPEYWTNVNNGTIASINYAAWFPTILEENAPDLAGKWALAPSPSESGSGPYADLGGSANIVTRDAEHVAQATDFLTWLSTDPDSLEILISDGGIFPAATAGFDNPALTTPSDYWGGVVVSDVFVAAAQNPATGSIAGPSYGVGATALSEDFAEVVAGDQTFREALESADATTVDAVKALGLTVR